MGSSCNACDLYPLIGRRKSPVHYARIVFRFILLLLFFTPTLSQTFLSYSVRPCFSANISQIYHSDKFGLVSLWHPLIPSFYTMLCRGYHTLFIYLPHHIQFNTSNVIHFLPSTNGINTVQHIDICWPCINLHSLQLNFVFSSSCGFKSLQVGVHCMIEKKQVGVGQLHVRDYMFLII